VTKERFICHLCFITLCSECQQKQIESKLEKKYTKKMPKCTHDFILSTSFDQAFELFLKPNAPTYAGKNGTKFRTVKQTIQKMNKMNKTISASPSPVSPFQLKENSIEKEEIMSLKQRISSLESELEDLKIKNEKLMDQLQRKEFQTLEKEMIQLTIEE
jgi:predicted RNase H-like nuclease (RuvC/YqgF family)